MRPDERKAAAERLLADETLALAFDKARQDSLQALATADAEDIHAIHRLQARAAAIDDIRQALREMILAAPREKKSVA
jgi:hypothetical protein